MLYLDRIFLYVLRYYPDIAPDMFMRLAKALNAQQFAYFMNHQAGFTIWFKVIRAMPKIPFIKALFRSLYD